MGIEPEFKDATGRVRHTDPKVSRALLNAMAGLALVVGASGIVGNNLARHLHGELRRVCAS